MKPIPVQVAPSEEQAAICQHIEDELRPIEAVVGRAQREIDLIRKYRTRFIADVVTSKLDVRHRTSPLGDELTEAEPEDLDEGMDDEVPGEDEPELVEDTGDNE